MTFHNEIPNKFQIRGACIFLLRNLFKKNIFLKEAQLENAKEIQNFLKEQHNPTQVIQVDRIENLDKKTFVKNYLNKGIAVIFSKEALNWESTKKWDLDYLATQFGKQEYPVINLRGLTEPGNEKEERKVLLENYIQALKNHETQDYLRFCSIIEANPSLEDDLDQTWLLKMKKCLFGISYQSFLGPAGRRTPLHSDTTAFFYIMVQGRKKWTMFSPAALSVLNPESEGKGYNYTRLNIKERDNEQYPGTELISRYECILKKGDILFVPSWTWHEVENLTESLGVSYRFTSLRSFFQFPLYAFLRLFFTKPNFLQIIYYSFFKNDLPQRDEFLLTPKIFFKKKN